MLEIGARDGYLSRRLAEHFTEITALDLEKPEWEFPGVTPVAGDVTGLQFPDDAFDCALCTEVLEPISALEQACRELVRLTRHEILIGMPFRQDTRVGRTTCRQCGKVNPPWAHVNTFDEQKLRRLFPGIAIQAKSLGRHQP